MPSALPFKPSPEVLITNTLYNYIHSMDADSPRLCSSCLTEDAIMDLTGFNHTGLTAFTGMTYPSISGREKITEHMGRLMSAMVTSHHVSNVRIMPLNDDIRATGGEDAADGGESGQEGKWLKWTTADLGEGQEGVRVTAYVIAQHFQKGTGVALKSDLVRGGPGEDAARGNIHGSYYDVVMVRTAEDEWKIKRFWVGLRWARGSVF